MTEQLQVAARRFTRHDISLRAKIKVAPPHATFVRYVDSSAEAQGWIDCDLLDFAAGGAAFISTVFVPRRCLLHVRIFGHARGSVALDALIRVQRIVMTDRRPAYLLGCSFEDAGSEQAAQIDALLARITGDTHPQAPTEAERARLR